MATFGSAVWAAGPYSAVYNSVAIGLMRGGNQQPFVRIARRSQIIKDTHLYGQTPIGAITQGGEGFAEFTVMEYIAASLATIWPFQSLLGGISEVGKDDYETFVQALAFTAASSTRAATAGPATLTCDKAVIAEDFDVKYELGPNLREIPLRFRLYPKANNALQFWSLT